MNHRFSPRALARFGRKKVRLGGLPCPLAWMAGFLGDRPWAGRPQRPPLPRRRRRPLPDLLRRGRPSGLSTSSPRCGRSWPGWRGDPAAQAVPRPPPGQPGRGRPKPSGGRRPAESTGNPGRPAGPADRTAHPGRDRLGRTGRPRRGIAQARKAAYRAGASRRLRRPVSLAEGPLPQQWLPLHRRRTLRKECCEHVRKEAKGPAHRRRPDGHPGGSPL